jgi:hypothetical protein
VPHQQQQAASNYNPFVTQNQPSVGGNNADPFLIPHGGLMQPPSSTPDMMAAMAMQRQQIVSMPMAPNASVPSPWALHPTVGQQQQQLNPMAPNPNLQSPWGLQPIVGQQQQQQQQLVPMPSNAIVQSPWAVQGVSYYLFSFMSREKRKLHFCTVKGRDSVHRDEY